MRKLEGKVAIISGSGRGIGKAIALKLATEGALVVVNDIDESHAEDVVNDINASGTKAVTCVGDVTAPDFGERFVTTALDSFGRLDIIVNNAGYTWDNVIQKMSDEQFQAMLDVHTIAPFRILRAAGDYIRSAAKQEAEEGGEIFRKVVNISSISGTHGNPGQVNYSAAKSAITGMTRTLAKEWGRYKVNVNCVAFAAIQTRLMQPVDSDKTTVQIGQNRVEIGVPEQQLKMMESMIPLGRAGTPEEAAGAVYLLCIPESNYISGQVLLAGGGV